MSGRLEHKHNLISRFFNGDKRRACIINGILILFFGFIRDWFYERALQDCHLSYSIRSVSLTYFGYALVGIGMSLVAAAYYRLGFLGTYLGDHFGILMKQKVEGFPFNVVSHPMYEGASMIFLGWGLIRRRISGIILSFWAYVVYMAMAKIVEEPFTNYIYRRNKPKIT